MAADSNEHPIQRARREFNEGARPGTTGDTEAMMRDLQEQAEQPEDLLTVYEVATDDLPELPDASGVVTDPDQPEPLTISDYRLLEGFDDGLVGA